MFSDDAHCNTFYLSGIGLALTTAGIIVNIGYYFQKRRNLMVTIMFVVPGIGMLISAPMGLLIFDTYGLSSSFLILAGLFAQTCVFGVLCKPSSLEKQFHIQRKISSSEHFNSEKGKNSYFDVKLSSSFYGALVHGILR